MAEFLWAALLGSPIGLTLGLLGGGGSILTVPILVYVMGLEEKAAIATSLLVVMVTSAFAAIPYARQGSVRWKTAASFAVMAMVGAFLGGKLAQFIPGWVLLIIFALLMITTAFFMWKGKKAKPDDAEPKTADWKLIATEGFIVGLVTGLVGAGGGFLVVPALVLLGGLSMREAVGTSLVVIVAKSFTGFLGYATHVEVDFALAGSVCAGAIGGALVGYALSGRISQPKLRRVFAIFVAVMGVVVLATEVGKRL